MFVELIKSGFSLFSSELKGDHWREISAKLYKYGNFGVFKYTPTKGSNKKILTQLLGVPVLFKSKVFFDNLSILNQEKLNKIYFSPEEMILSLFKKEMIIDINSKQFSYSLNEFKILIEECMTLLNTFEDKGIIDSDFFEKALELMKTDNIINKVSKKIRLQYSYEKLGGIIEKDIKKEMMDMLRFNFENRIMKKLLNTTDEKKLIKKRL